VAYYPFNGNALDAGGNNLHGVMKTALRMALIAIRTEIRPCF
jgi:hypothetical protein